MTDETTMIPWDGKGNPYAIATQFNPIMNQWDVIVHVGGFRTQQEAEMATHYMAPHVQKMLGGTQKPARSEAAQ